MPLPDDPEGTPALEEAVLPPPATVPTHISEPPLSSDPGAVEDSQPGGSEEANGTEEKKAFDPKHVEAFNGLVFLGALTDEFEWLGHKFIIKTLTTDELLSVGSIVREWDDTIAANRAYTTAMAALATVSVDGRELPMPYEETQQGDAWARQRFNYVKARWYPFTVDAVYERYLSLEETTRGVIEEMGKAYG